MNGQRPPSEPGCTWAEDCIETCTGPSVHLREQGVGATFVNRRRSHIRKIHYDHCYFRGRGRRADYIVGLPDVVDVIVELEGSDTNLKDAAQQVEATLDAWEQDTKSARKIACLIVYGRIEGKKKLPGRVPRLEAVASGLRADFLNRRRTLLRIHENGKRKFTFRDFLG